MTLIVQVATANFVVQVTDRLVSQGRQPFDKFANKNLIYSARNAIVSIAYTGAAYIESIPTDQWIAQKLSGFTWPRNERPPAMTVTTRGKKPKPWPDIGMSLRKLVGALQKYSLSLKGERQKVWAERNFIISIAGFQWNKKGHWRPLLAQVHKLPGKLPGGLQCSFWQEDRNWLIKRPFHLSWGPRENLIQAEKDLLLSKMSAARPREIDKAIAEGIREVAARNSVVGPNCMGIFIDAPTRPEVWVRYLPAQPTKPNKAKIPYGSKRKEMDIVFTPWVIGPESIIAPSVIGGAGWLIPTGHYEVHLNGNQKEGDIAEGLFIQGQPRKLF